MTIIGALPNNIANGQTMDAGPVMADFNYIVNQVNANALGAASVQINAASISTASGTADALVGSYTPGITALTSGMLLYLRASSANVTATPTFTPSSGVLAPATIVKTGSVALVSGDIAGAGHWLILQYDQSLGQWELLNPATAVNVTQNFKNKIVNGAMQVDQRNVGASQSFTPGAALAYTIDRFYAFCAGGAGLITGQQVAGPIANTYRYKFTGIALNAGVAFGTRLEAINTARMSGQTATLQAKLALSTPANVTWAAYYATTKDTFGTVASPSRTLIATGTFSATASETLFSTQIAVPAAATTGIEVVFSVASLLAAATWTIGDIQLVQESAPSAFEELPYEVSLARCQKFYWQLRRATGVLGTSTSCWRMGRDCPVVMRSTPALLPSSTPTIQAGASASVGLSAITNNYSTVFSVEFDCTVATSGGALGSAAVMLASNDVNNYIGISSEL